MRFHTYFLILVLSVAAVSCKQEAKQQEPQQPEAKATVFQEVVSPAGVSSSLPHLVSNSDLTLLSWVETAGDTLATFKYSELVDGIWLEPQTILQGTDWFVNWADYPMIAENKGNLWSHVLKKSTVGTYSYDVKMNIKPKSTAEWKTNLPLHTDGTPTEHGFVSVIPYNDSFFVNWLDGRNTEENDAGERGAMTLRAAVVSSTGDLTQEKELDVSTCDCCQTTSAITDNGPIVVYRDRSEDEIRDIYIVRQVNGEWTAPKTIHADNWKIKGCPVNGPKVSAMGNNVVAAWFTGAQNKPRVQVVFSNDGGEQFQEPILIAEGNVLGRVDVLWMDEETAVVSWMESQDKQTILKAVKVSNSSKQLIPVVIAKMNSSRKSGFPQMELVKDKVHFAWTDVDNGTTTIKTGYVGLAQF